MPPAFSRFHADAPIRSDDEDALGVGWFADRLVVPLLDAPGGPSLVVGLYGAWGQGKSSLLNLLAARLRATKETQTVPGRPAEVQAVVVRFNPWLYGDVAALLYAFFETLAAEIGGSGALARGARGTLTKEFRAMGGYVAAGLGVAAALFPAATAAGVAAAALPPVTDEVARRVSGGEPGFDKHRRAVEATLRSLGAQGRPLRVVVLVDDLDRASGPEVVAMLKLVRLAADLPNVSYVLAMDDARVRDVLTRQTSEAYGASFLEKIVQVPVHVPAVDPARLRALVTDEAAVVAEAAGLDPGPLREFGHESYLPHNNYDHLVAPRVRTVRDARRLLNAFRFALLTSDRNPDLHPVDLLLLCVLQAFYPGVYAGVRVRRHFLLGTDASWRHIITGGRNKEADLRARRAELLAIARGDRAGAAPSAEVPDVGEPGPADAVGHGAPGAGGVAVPARQPADAIPVAVLQAIFPDAQAGSTRDDWRGVQRRRAENRVASGDRFDGYFRLEPTPDDVPGTVADRVFAMLTAAPPDGVGEGADPGTHGSAVAGRADEVASQIATVVAGYNQAECENLWSKVGDRTTALDLDQARTLARRAPAVIAHGPAPAPPPGLLRAVDHAARALVHGAVVQGPGGWTDTAEDVPAAEALLVATVDAIPDPVAALRAARAHVERLHHGPRLPDHVRRVVAAAGAARAARATAGADSPLDVLGLTAARKLWWAWADLLRVRDGAGAGTPLADLRALTARMLDADPGSAVDVLALASRWEGDAPVSTPDAKLGDLLANLREAVDPSRLLELLARIDAGEFGPVRRGWNHLIADFRERVAPALAAAEQRETQDVAVGADGPERRGMPGDDAPSAAQADVP